MALCCIPSQWVACYVLSMGFAEYRKGTRDCIARLKGKEKRHHIISEGRWYETIVVLMVSTVPV